MFINLRPNVSLIFFSLGETDFFRSPPLSLHLPRSYTTKIRGGSTRRNPVDEGRDPKPQKRTFYWFTIVPEPPRVLRGRYVHLGVTFSDLNLHPREGPRKGSGRVHSPRRRREGRVEGGCLYPSRRRDNVPHPLPPRLSPSGSPFLQRKRCQSS